jgi:hypothetical protein
MKQETLEEAAERYISEDNNNRYYEDFIQGAKWAQERMYSEEEMKKAFYEGQKELSNNNDFSKLLEQFKKL